MSQEIDFFNTKEPGIGKFKLTAEIIKAFGSTALEILLAKLSKDNRPTHERTGHDPKPPPIGNGSGRGSNHTGLPHGRRF